MMVNNEDLNLLQTMREVFNEDELRDVCFSLHIDYEDLPASLGKAGKVRELILLCAQNEQLADLILICQTERPDFVWPNPEKLPMLGTLLGKPQKPVQPFEPEMLWVTAGEFLLGSAAGADVPVEETPQHNLYLPAYQIGKFPVTNRQFAEFLKQRRLPSPKGWLGLNPPRDHSGQVGWELPVVQVSWFDAQAYCAWLAQVTERPYRLPTEAEWEKAARGTDGRIFPWGNEWDAARCGAEALMPVGAYPDGASPYGCLAMVGNVREWTSTAWGTRYDLAEFTYPYNAQDGREAGGEDTAVYRVVRGSSYEDPQSRHRCTSRAWYAPDNKNKYRGFRVALSFA